MSLYRELLKGGANEWQSVSLEGGGFNTPTRFDEVQPGAVRGGGGETADAAATNEPDCVDGGVMDDDVNV